MLLLQNSSYAQSYENEKLFPDWIKQPVTYWMNGDITDSEFFTFVENILNNDIIPNEIELNKELMRNAKNTIYEPEINEEKSYDQILVWTKDRSKWWINEKITDLQFLQTIHILKEIGYLESNPETNLFLNEETFKSSLEKFLLSEDEILNITRATKWRFISTEYEFEENKGVTDSVKILLKDITRVYEPMFYKHKVPSMIMQISEFGSTNDLNNYWNSFEGKDKQTIFDSAYLTGNPNENSECFFNYTSEGAVTSCIYENMIIQIVIYDYHNEHYEYDVKDIELDEFEPTSRFLSEILKKISYYKNTDVNYQLHKILQKSIQYNDSLKSTEEKITSKSVDPEKSIIQGVRNFSCERDDFGLITIMGQYNNDNVKRSQVHLVVSFFDNEGNSIGKSTATFYDLKEFETKKFKGHSKWNENFHTCQISIE